ncbi:Protein of unknown function (DUF2974) [Butyrivibrio fibrisolvens 16/4]|nr:Protein of unknown function (DUF2974) [Butyrivibrio fibrisolvens 16/4]
MTDQELGLLEHVTYIDKNVLEIAFPGEGKEILKIKDTKTIKSVLKDFNEDALNNLRKYGDKTIDGAMMSGNEWADVIEQIQHNSNLNSLKVVNADTYTNSIGDTYNLNICYSVPGTKQCIVTYKGTTGFEEWNDNVYGILEADTQRQKDALDFYNDYTKKFDDVIVVGHSKGANKAMYVTIKADDDKISRCVAFDGQGFSNLFLNTYSDRISDRAGLITNYYISTDFVHVLMKQIPGIREKSCKGYGMSNGAQYHSPNSFFALDKNGKIKVDDNNSPIFVKEEENENIKLIRGFVTYVMDHSTDEDLLEIAECLGPAAGRVLGEKDTIKMILHLVSRPTTLIKIRKLVSAYAEENNLGKIRFASFLETFGVGFFSKYIIAVICCIIFYIDPKVKEFISSYDFIISLLKDAMITLNTDKTFIKNLCDFLDYEIMKLKEKVNALWDRGTKKVSSFVSNLSSDVVRNYTTEFKEELIGLYNEIHCEELFDVARFVYAGGWNTGFIDHIGIDDNIDYTKRIYRKIDEQDEDVVLTIRDMFDRANQLDSEYANILNSQTEQLQSLTSAFRLQLEL